MRQWVAHLATVYLFWDRHCEIVLCGSFARTLVIATVKCFWWFIQQLACNIGLHGVWNLLRAVACLFRRVQRHPFVHTSKLPGLSWITWELSGSSFFKSTCTECKTPVCTECKDTHLQWLQRYPSVLNAKTPTRAKIPICTECKNTHLYWVHGLTKYSKLVFKNHK